MNDLASQGKKLTLAAIHAALDNRGSMSTLVRLRAEIEAETQQVSDSPEALKAFREIWSSAVAEGRKNNEAERTELRETITALAAENERLEGVVMAAQNHVAELKSAKAYAEAELVQVKVQADGDMKQSRNALADATTQAAGALQKLAEAQACHAAQVAVLQADLNAAVRKSHASELQVVRCNTLLEATSVQIAAADKRESRHAKLSSDKTKSRSLITKGMAGSR